MARLPVDQVRELARGRWLQIIQETCSGIDLGTPLTKHRPCPVHGGRDGFRFFRDTPDTGGGYCNSCGPFADGFALIGWYNGWDFRQSVLAVISALGEDEKNLRHNEPNSSSFRPKAGKRTESEKKKALSDAQVRSRRTVLNKLWSEAVPLMSLPSDSLPARYFNRRGIDWLTVRSQRSLRFHQGLIYNGIEGEAKQQILPAILARFFLADGRPVTFHRTFLDPDGNGKSGKADVAEPKRMMKCLDSPVGGAIRLKGTRSLDVINVCEGLETGLSILEGTALDTYVCTTATLMEGFEPPPGKKVLIWVDADLPKVLRPGADPVDVGGKAGDVLLKRLHAKGITASIRRPFIPVTEKSVDWNDVHAALGVPGILAGLYNAPPTDRLEHAYLV